MQTLTTQSCRKGRRTSRRDTSEPVWYRLRTRDWEFFVSSELEAFSILARHDVEQIDDLTMQ